MRPKSSRASLPRKTLKPDNAAEPPWIAVARIEGLFGIRGELKCRPSGAGEGLFESGRAFALDASGGAQLVCAAARLHKGRPLVRFAGIDDATAAQSYVGRTLFARVHDIELAEDEFLDADLVGFTLLDEAGSPLGTIAAVEHYPAADYLVVGEQRALVPMVREFIRAVDRAARTMTVSLPAGLLDPSAAEKA
jgi:16S rRNA processing protein RimM